VDKAASNANYQIAQETDARDWGSGGGMCKHLVLLLNESSDSLVGPPQLLGLRVRLAGSVLSKSVKAVVESFSRLR